MMKKFVGTCADPENISTGRGIYWDKYFLGPWGGGGVDSVISRVNSNLHFSGGLSRTQNTNPSNELCQYSNGLLLGSWTEGQRFMK